MIRQGGIDFPPCSICLYETATEDGVTKNYHYLTAANGLFANFVTSSNGEEAMYYTLKDHQGSLAAVIQPDGAVERLSYDAWGRRRNADGFGYDNVPTPMFDRGFTLHEHYDGFGLINMNGRMYDPAVGRMLSPDIVIQQEHNSQAYNRYSYCFNNPLRFTDPSGYVVDIDPKFLNMFLYASSNENIRFFSDEIRELGIDPQSIQYSTEESEGLNKTTISWMIGDDSYELVRLQNMLIPQEKQSSRNSCAAKALEGQEQSLIQGNLDLDEAYWMCISPSSEQKGISVRIASDELIQNSNGFNYVGEQVFCDSEGNLLPEGRNDICKDTYRDLSEKNGVLFVLDTPIGNHAVNAVSAAKLSINGKSPKSNNYSVWYWDTAIVGGGYKQLNTDKLNSVMYRYLYAK